MIKSVARAADRAQASSVTNDADGKRCVMQSQPNHTHLLKLYFAREAELFEQHFRYVDGSGQAAVALAALALLAHVPAKGANSGRSRSTGHSPGNPQRMLACALAL